MSGMNDMEKTQHTFATEEQEEGMKRCLSEILSWNIRFQSRVVACEEQEKMGELSLLDDYLEWQEIAAQIGMLHIIDKTFAIGPMLFAEAPAELSVEQLMYLTRTSAPAAEIVKRALAEKDMDIIGCAEKLASENVE